jgi:hypothetical protein
MVSRSPGIFNDGNRGRGIRKRECNGSFEALSVAAMGIGFHGVSSLVENSSFQFHRD